MATTKTTMMSECFTKLLCLWFTFCLVFWNNEFVFRDEEDEDEEDDDEEEEEEDIEESPVKACVFFGSTAVCI